MLLNSKIIILSVGNSLEVWKNNLFPTLFPFFIISNLLISYGFIEILANIFNTPIKHLFKCSPNSSFIILMSMISGIPSNAKYIKDLLSENKISLKEANKLILFTHFSNPLFILGTIGNIYLNNYKLGIFILISHYVTNLILGITLRIKDTSQEEKEKNLMLNNLKGNNNFGKVLSKSLNTSIDTILLILGVITFFNILTTIISESLNIKNLLIKSIITSIFEMTSGLNLLRLTNISLRLKTILMTMIISFGGLSTHMQVISILDNKKIRYFPYLIFRIIHALLSGIICFILVYNNTF